INKSLTDNKPYDKMAVELITAQGTNSYEQGELNWMVGGRVTGGPAQDIMDQMAVNVGETFLGLSNLNCLMCHDGPRPLATWSLCGKDATLYQAYQMSSFFSKTRLATTRVTPAVGQPYSWSVADDPPRPASALNTTTGNRPTRSPVGSVRNVPPLYLFS